jgi:two-component system chemotaxis response regulator CheY
MRILIVDDSRVMRQIVRRALRQAGFDDYEYEEAENGKEALNVALNNPPGLILSDWNMPEMSGIESLTAMRAAGCNVPFGFVTSEGSADMRQQAKDAGALFLIAKPFTDDAMREALSGVLV